MTIGIDLGTTNSLVAVYEAGFPGILADSDGNRITPSAVWFPRGRPPVAGAAALRMRAAEPDRTVLSVKRLMGLRADEVPADLFALVVIPGPAGAAGIRLDDTFHSPEAISALILGKLKKDAEHALGAAVDSAVITVPAYFNDAQRTATRRAGELAGFEVKRILSEPTAAALAFGLGRGDRATKQRIAVFDFGGGTFDLSVLELQNGVFEVLSTRGDTRLGGDDIDRALARLIIEKSGVRISNPAEHARVLDAARSAKTTLSSELQTKALLPFLADGNLDVSLTRPELESAAASTLQRIPPLCRRALHDAELSPRDLDRVLLVGGSTRMPCVRQLANEIFGIEPDTSQHPDESIALGAAIQAAILDERVGGVTLLDVTPLSLGIETFGGLMNVLIPRNTTIPCKTGEMFTNAAAGQTAMRISVLQGEREMACDNWKLGELEIPFTPAEKGRARVGVQFELDADGILTVLARDVAKGADHVLKIDNSAVNVGEAKVEAMISDSIEHAFDDMSERVFVEASQKADELLAGVDMAMEKIGERIEDGERQAIVRLAKDVRDAMNRRDAAKLKPLVEQLDDLTEPLAAKLLESL